MGLDDQSKTYQRQNPASKRSYLDAFGHKRPDSSTINDHHSRLQGRAQGTLSPSTTPLQPSLKAEKRKQSRTRGAVEGGNESNGVHHGPDLDLYDLTSLDGGDTARPQVSSSPKLRSPRARPRAPVIKTKPENEAKTRNVPSSPEPQTTTNRKPKLARTVYGAATRLKHNRERDLTGKHQPSASRSSSSAIALDEPLAHRLSLVPRASSGSTRRERLIDNLAHQGVADSQDAFDPQDSRSPSRSHAASNPEHATANATAPRHDRMTKVSTTVKFTYGSRRSMLRETSSEDQIQPRTSSPVPMALTLPKENDLFSLDAQFLSDHSDDDTSHKGAVQSIHELRQAGANNRFADAIDDLLDRVGLPQNESPSLRRGALLDLAVKLHQKPFLLQFRDHGAPRTLFNELHKERDMVNAFALISSLLTLLLGNAPLPSYKSLQEEGICPLLERMLHHNEDICVIAGQQRLSVPRKNQPALSTLRAAVGGLSVWDSPPKLISPRTLALKFMHLACQSPEGTDCIKTSEDITEVLFSLLKAYLRSNRLKNDASVRGRDYLMVVSILEGLSVTTSTSEVAVQWTQEYLHTISTALDTALACAVADFGPSENSVLKLAMNATNNNPSAAVIWQDRKHLQNLTKASTTYFRLVKDGVAKGSWNGEFYNRLLLILGVMINVCEHISSSHSLLEGDSLDDLISTFLENSSSTKEVSYDGQSG